MNSAKPIVFLECKFSLSRNREQALPASRFMMPECLSSWDTSLHNFCFKFDCFITVGTQIDEGINIV
jgi:hypothetical protein